MYSMEPTIQSRHWPECTLHGPIDYSDKKTDNNSKDQRAKKQKKRKDKKKQNVHL